MISFLFTINYIFGIYMQDHNLRTEPMFTIQVPLYASRVSITIFILHLLSFSLFFFCVALLTADTQIKCGIYISLTKHLENVFCISKEDDQHLPQGSTTDRFVMSTPLDQRQNPAINHGGFLTQRQTTWR